MNQQINKLAGCPVIALDAMGGDHGLETTLEAARLAVQDGSVQVCFVGDTVLIEEKFREAKLSSAERSRIEIVHSAEVVTMDDHPGEVLKSKRQSSLAVGFELVKNGRANGFVSAGNSGAVMAFALGVLGRIRGIQRPAIACTIPTSRGTYSVLVDAGANTICKPFHLVQFGAMGALYAELIFGAQNPSVGLVSNGEERSKGNPLTQETDQLLRKSGLNYFGYIEGRDIPAGVVDVSVCDGFVGNVILKTAEGIGRALKERMIACISERLIWKAGILLARGGLRKAFSVFDPARYGGAPLLGVNGISIISHGNSSPKALCNAIWLARDLNRKNWLEKMKQYIDKAGTDNDGADASFPVSCKQ